MVQLFLLIFWSLSWPCQTWLSSTGRPAQWRSLSWSWLFPGMQIVRKHTWENVTDMNFWYRISKRKDSSVPIYPWRLDAEDLSQTETDVWHTCVIYSWSSKPKKSRKTVVNLLCWELMQFTVLETVNTGTAHDYSSHECWSSPVIYLYIWK